MNRVRREHVFSIPISMLLSCLSLVPRLGISPALRRQIRTITLKSADTVSTQRVCTGSIAAHIDKFAGPTRARASRYQPTDRVLAFLNTL
jgi:hypothetical protein